MKKKYSIALLALFGFAFTSWSQGSPDYSDGLKVKLNDDGSKYFRVISWAQFWAQHNSDRALDANGNEPSDLNFSVRRARVLLYSQISKDFLIVTHFGLNSLNADNMSPTGKGESSQLFLHDVWGQWNLGENHAIGGGLHYWNGISRLNNQSTLNMLTLDNNRQSWSTLGLSDQFARHIGVYLKGSFDKFQYRVSINDAVTNNLDTRSFDQVNAGEAIYGGKRLLGTKKASKTYAGYFEYGFKDTESNFLPYKVGSYLGTKEVFNVGAGFFLHPNGAVVDTGSSPQGEDVSIFAVDAFYDAPIGENGSVITAYAAYQSNDYGNDYLYNAYGTGSMVYAHCGYVLPTKLKTKFQPYISYASNSYDAVDDNRNVFGVGANVYLNGHNSKLTLEYQNTDFGSVNTNTITLQAMIYL